MTHTQCIRSCVLVPLSRASVGSTRHEYRSFTGPAHSRHQRAETWNGLQQQEKKFESMYEYFGTKPNDVESNEDEWKKMYHHDHRPFRGGPATFVFLTGTTSSTTRRRRVPTATATMPMQLMRG